MPIDLNSSERKFSEFAPQLTLSELKSENEHFPPSDGRRGMISYPFSYAAQVFECVIIAKGRPFICGIVPGLNYQQ